MDKKRSVAILLAACSVIATLVGLPAQAAAAEGAPAIDGGAFHPLEPVRILDTRDGTGGFNTPLGAGQTITVPVLGQGGIPTDGVSAVVLNVTATNTAQLTYLTVWPTGQDQPTASNLNPAAGQSVPNLVEVGVGEGGAVDVFNESGTVDVILDVAGWVGEASEVTNAGLFHSLSPSRLLDTRDGTGVEVPGTVGPGGVVTLNVAGRGGVPETGVSAVVVNLTITEPTTETYITGYPGGTRPVVSNLNAAPGRTVANRAQLKLGPDGTVSLYNFAGNAHLIVDVNGWFSDGTAPNSGARFVGVTPVRLLDTRLAGQGPPAGAGTTIDLPVADRFGLPGMGDQVPPTAAVLNVTVTGTDSVSYITAHPGGTALPLASDLNWGPGGTVPNLTVVKLGQDGNASIYNFAGTAHVIVDLLGYYTGDVVLDPGLHVLHEPETSAITALTETTITFAGIPAALADIIVGDTLNAGVSPQTPDGLMRRVTTVDIVEGNLVLTTVTASLDELIDSGSAHLYNEGGGSPVVADAVPGVTPQMARSAPLEGSLDRELSLSAAINFPLGSPDVKVGGALTVTLGFSLHFDIGLGRFDLGFEGSAGISLEAKLTAQHDFDVASLCLVLGRVTLTAPIVVIIGPVVMIFLPNLKPKIYATGSVTAGMSGGFHANAKIAFGIEHKDGVTTPRFTKEGEFGAINPDGPLPVQPILKPKLKVETGGDVILLLNGFTVSEVGPQFPLELEYDGCSYIGKVSVDVAITFELSFWKFTAVKVTFRHTLATFDLFTITVTNCAYWVGTITEHHEDHNYSQPFVGNDFVDHQVWTLVKPEPFRPQGLAGTLEHTSTGTQGRGCTDEHGNTVIRLGSSDTIDDQIEISAMGGWGPGASEGTLDFVPYGERASHVSGVAYGCDGTATPIPYDRAFPETIAHSRYGSPEGDRSTFVLSPTGLSSSGSRVVVDDTNDTGGHTIFTITWDLQKQCTEGPPTSC